MMVAGGVLVVLGFIGLALRQNRNADPRERLETNRQARHKPIKGEGRRGNRMVKSSLAKPNHHPRRGRGWGRLHALAAATSLVRRSFTDTQKPAL